MAVDIKLYWLPFLFFCLLKVINLNYTFLDII